MTTAEIVGAARSIAVMPLGYIGHREVRMGPGHYEQLSNDLKVQGFGKLCGLPVKVIEDLKTVEFVGMLGVIGPE
jgi:hypothetical protein